MQKFSNEKKKGQKLPYTHTLTYAPYGAYNIPDDMYAKFRKLYEDAIVAGYTPHVTEKHREFGPIVIDFDFVQSKEHSKRSYTEKTIMNMVKLYNSVLKQYLDVPSNKLHAYVCEKKEPVLRKGEYHDGIHVVYPFICTKPSLQMIMREDFLKVASERKIFRKIPLVNDLESVFDKGVIYHTNWMMYGSRKDPGSHPYYVTHIYHSINNKVYDTLVPGDDINKRSYIKHFIDALSCRRFHSSNEITPLADNVDPEAIDQKINKMKEKIGDHMTKKQDIAALMGSDINFIKAVGEDVFVEAKNLVKLFSKNRATDYYSWYQVGRCLHNIDYRLLDDWIEFSKKCKSKFKVGECETLWKKMKPSNYTMATLHYFASRDNPKKYLEMKEEKLSKLLDDGLEASHRTIAKLIMERHKFTYKCASIKHNTWYEFRNHRWIEIDSAYTLRNLISDELTIEYARKQGFLYEAQKDMNDWSKKKCIDEATHISKVIKQLNNSTFKNGVIRECADLAHDPNFLKLLDENIYLLCFENGIYDLETDTFRDGCPDDYVSLCTNYKFIEYDERDEFSKEIDDFLEKIQPDPMLRKYLMTLLSICLAGSIGEESFYVFTGSGANGKSKLMELLKYTLGDLFKPMDVRLLTDKRACSSAASPEVADKKGIRACPFDEPKATDEINTSFMKIFTGGDLITARALFKEPIYFKPQFKPFLLCNRLPNINADDDGTWRRIKVLEFGSKFVVKSKKATKKGLGKNQFWADIKLTEKLPDWKQAFMGKLLAYYRSYKKEGLVHPKEVTKATANYRKRCDVFQDYIGDYLEKTDNTKDSISVADMHAGMRSWYKANYDGKCPNTKELRNYLQHRMPTYDNKTDGLQGYRLKSDESNAMDELVAVAVAV